MAEGRKIHKSRILKIIIALFVTLILVGIIYMIAHQLQQNTLTIISPLAENTKKSNNTIFFFFTKKKDPDDLKKLVKQIVGSSWNNYSVYVKDYSSDFMMGIDEMVTYNAASVSKILILAALYFQTQSGIVDLSKTITLQKEDIQDYGTGSMRYDSPGTTYSIQTLAKLMMQQSDNTAAHILTNHIIGFETLQQLVTNWGLHQTDMNKNITSNYDMELILEKIIKEKITNHSYTKEMLAFMKDSDFEDRIPLYLPKDSTVYHKIGNGPGNVHDVGVVMQGNTQYYIGFLTSDITNEDQAKELEGKISKAVYNFLTP